MSNNSKNEININIEDLVQPSFYKLMQWFLYCIKERNGDFGDINMIVLPGGRASGKSVFATVCKVLSLLILQRPVITIMRNEIRLRKTTFSAMKNVIKEKLKLQSLFKFTTKPLEVRLKSDQDIKALFFGADDSEGLKSLEDESGRGFAIVHIEEADKIESYEALQNILASIRGSNYLIIMTYNPPINRNNWIFEYEIPTKNRIVVFSTYLTMPKHWLKDTLISIIDEMANSINPARRRQYRWMYLGIPVSTGAEVFNNVYDLRITDEEIQNYINVYTILKGHDFGYGRDPSATINCIYIKETHTLRIFNELKLLQPNDDLLALKLLEMEKITYYCGTIYGDSQAAGHIRNLNLRGVTNMQSVIKRAGSVDAGWNWLMTLNKIEIDKERCPNTYDEFTKSEWKRDRNNVILSIFPSKKEDKNNHFIDATRYACMELIYSDTSSMGYDAGKEEEDY